MVKFLEETINIVPIVKAKRLLVDFDNLEYFFSSRHFLRPVFTPVSPLWSDLSLTWVNRDFKWDVGRSFS